MSDVSNNQLKNSIIIQILDNSIDKLNNLNRTFHRADQLPRLTPYQEQVFCDIFNSAYSTLKKKTDDLITYNSNNNTYTIKVSNTSPNSLNLTFLNDNNYFNVILTENEFIKLIVDSILFAMFKYQRSTVWTLDLYENNVLVSNPSLKRNYHLLMSLLSLHILKPPELSIKLKQLADDYPHETVNPSNINNSPLPLPSTPEKGWPTDKKGGKYKKSPSKKSNKRKKLFTIKRKNKRKRPRTSSSR